MSGTSFYQWRQLQEEARRRVWWLYGWFSGLMLCGSCFGAVTWAARMTNLVYYFQGSHLRRNGNITDPKGASLLALAYGWLPTFVVTYAIEFLCLSVAKLMVLDRMSDFAAGQDEGARKRWAAGGRVVMAVVVLGNAVGLAANVAAAVFYQRSSEAMSSASVFFAADMLFKGNQSDALSTLLFETAVTIRSVQAFSEVAVLLLIVASFVVAGVVCALRVNSLMALLREVDTASAASEAGRTLRLRILVTTGFVFVAFVLRSIFSTMFAVANQGQEIAAISGQQRCAGVESFCNSCTNVYTHISRWMLYTPEFQLTITMISSPLALLVALWGMTPRLLLNRRTNDNNAARMTRLVT